MATLPIYLFSISSHPEAHHINPLFVTFFKPKIDFSRYDAFIITSKQAVEALKQYDRSDFSHIPALCISKATANAYKSLGGAVLDVGKGYGDTLLEKITQHPKERKWLYLRAETIASDFASKARMSGYEVAEKTLYKSECSQQILKTQIPNEAILIFTSPSSVRCYLQNHVLFPSQKVVVIGKTTAKALPKESECIVSDDTTIERCMQIAKSL